MLVLPIFPINSLAESVITTVWVGIWVIVFFNQWLGWSLSGLIVPGYLVPLMILKPLSAIVIGVEGVVTYFLAWFFFRFLANRGWWYPIFGRDRFFLLVLLSVAARIAFDYLLIPHLLAVLPDTWRPSYSYASQMHSFGLIIIALLANQFWKPGFKKGILPVLTLLLVTYVLVRFGLMATTNFSIGAIEYLYEDVATDILASPKAYIIILSAAFLASRMNLLYGWEFNGILIPSLLALMWYQPLKLLVTAFETIWVLVLASLLLKLPWFAKITIEGSRKILFFFNVAFVWKWLLGFGLLYWAPELKVTDFYGFGYVITTLLAVKMHEKGIVVRMTRATFQISIIAALGANIIGFALTWLPLGTDPTKSIPSKIPHIEGTLENALNTLKISLYQPSTGQILQAPSRQARQEFSRAIQILGELKGTERSSQLETAEQLLQQINYQIQIVQNRFLVLHEKTLAPGRGIFVIDTQAGLDCLVYVPQPLDEWLILESACRFSAQIDTKFMAFNTLSNQREKEMAYDPTTNRASYLHAFFDQFGQNKTLSFNSLNQRNARTIGRVLQKPVTPSGMGFVFIKKQLPNRFPLDLIQKTLGPFEGVFARGPSPNAFQDRCDFGHVDFYISRSQLQFLFSRPQQADLSAAEEIREQTWDDLRNELSQKRTEPYPDYVAPSLTQLLYLEQEVLKPILQRLEDQEIQGNELNYIAEKAKVLGLELRKIKHEEGRLDLYLGEDERRLKGWGFALFALRQSEPLILEVPRSEREINTLALALTWYDSQRAQILLANDPFSRKDPQGLSDPLQRGNRLTLLNQIHQTLLRQQDKPNTVLQVRAASADQDSGIYLAANQPLGPTPLLPEHSRPILDWLKQISPNMMEIVGQPYTADFGLNGNPQAEFMAHVPRHFFLSAWISSDLRAQYRSNPTRLHFLFAAFDLSPEEVDVVESLTQAKWQKWPQSDVEAAAQFIQFGDVMALSQMLEKGYQLHWLQDRPTRKPFLLVQKGRETLALINPAGNGNQVEASDPTATQLELFVHSQNGLLLRGSQ